MTSDEVRGRIASVCASAPFRLTLSTTPFSFELQPSGLSDQVFRLESESAEVIGGFNYREDRFEVVTIWVARKYAAQPEAAYRSLLADANSIRAAIIRDACEQSGHYSVPDRGAGMSLNRDPGQSYGVLRLTVPVNYETTV